MLREGGGGVRLTEQAWCTGGVNRGRAAAVRGTELALFLWVRRGVRAARDCHDQVHFRRICSKAGRGGTLTVRLKEVECKCTLCPTWDCPIMLLKAQICEGENPIGVDHTRCRWTKGCGDRACPRRVYLTRAGRTSCRWMRECGDRACPMSVDPTGIDGTNRRRMRGCADRACPMNVYPVGVGCTSRRWTAVQGRRFPVDDRVGPNQRGSYLVTFDGCTGGSGLPNQSKGTNRI